MTLCNNVKNLKEIFTKYIGIKKGKLVNNVVALSHF